jgi:hypothetical protein
MTATPYTRSLEVEVARQGAEIHRLRAENRALLNSILGIAGVPPIPATEPGDGFVAQTLPCPERSRGMSVPDSTSSRGETSPSSVAGRSSATPLRNRRRRAATTSEARIAAPLRRRSWHQINRMLEFESARKPVASDQ